MFPRVYDVIMRSADRLGVAARRRALADGARGLTIELGAGTGLQFPHYRAGVRVIAVEPDYAMLERARARCLEKNASI